MNEFPETPKPPRKVNWFVFFFMLFGPIIVFLGALSSGVANGKTALASRILTTVVLWGLVSCCYCGFKLSRVFRGGNPGWFLILLVSFGFLILMATVALSGCGLFLMKL